MFDSLFLPGHSDLQIGILVLMREWSKLVDNAMRRFSPELIGMSRTKINAWSPPSRRALLMRLSSSALPSLLLCSVGGLWGRALP
jgi:hypothetical protein